ATLVFIVVDVFVYRLNQWARSKQLLPLETQLEALLHSAETGEPLDETLVADLRPVVVSMAAADEVRAAEFRVAFWQIAVWGEIGFIGIWFFLMLDLASDNQDWKEAAAKTARQTAGAEATNRYSIFARKLIDRLNADDYAAVQRLYNPE